MAQQLHSQVLGWPKSSFGFFRNILWKNPIELFGQPNIYQYTPKSNENMSPQKTCIYTLMLIATLFIMTPKCKQSNVYQLMNG